MISKKHLNKSYINTNILRKNSAFFAKYICNYVNASIHSSEFHVEVKEADIVPVNTNMSKVAKENYRPISILPNISKVYERCLYDKCQIISKLFFQNINVIFVKDTILDNIAFELW